MTLNDLAAWHRKQRDDLYKQSDRSFRASQDGRCSEYTRQAYANDCRNCVDIARFHDEAATLILAAINPKE